MPDESAVSDGQIIARYRVSGDAHDLEQLVHRHLPRIRALVYQMVLDDAAADDVTQDVFIKAIQQLDRFRGDAEFGTWLYRVAVNTTYTFLRRRRQSPVKFDSVLPEGSVGRDDPEVAVLTDELDEQIRGALAQLSPKLRGALVLTTMQGISPSEAAKLEGCTTSTLYWRIHEARNQLRQRLQKYVSS